MCSHYTALKKQEQLEKYFGARGIPLPPKSDMWPRYQGPFIRRPPEHDSGDEAVPERETVVGRWGLISAMTKADGLDKAGKLSTFNAKSETAHQLWTFRNAWAKGQRCIIPADAIFEPDWRSGVAVATRFTRADGAPLGIAGLWDRYRDAAGQRQESYTMLTINADEDPLFRDYHQAGKEKRMVVILPEGAYGDWLTAPADATRDFLVPYPADRLVAVPQPK
ncbi:SOS response-associated peptidase [Achromobacter denitrificans]|uniref:SOS response-associated peptidase n=1 Tax=Achromobacter denitrificans TaxID=32002 RepID=UPI000F66AE8E|nr:SOS response-associated peptidase family protein [Achromobacter denitrificans]RSE80869.1 SOS response-associated peptidase [Achromobacter denitrificans]